MTPSGGTLSAIGGLNVKSFLTAMVTVGLARPPKTNDCPRGVRAHVSPNGRVSWRVPILEPARPQMRCFEKDSHSCADAGKGEPGF